MKNMIKEKKNEFEYIIKINKLLGPVCYFLKASDCEKCARSFLSKKKSKYIFLLGKWKNMRKVFGIIQNYIM